MISYLQLPSEIIAPVKIGHTMNELCIPVALANPSCPWFLSPTDFFHQHNFFIVSVDGCRILMSKERLHRFQLPIITTSNQHHNPMNIFFMIAHVICHGSFFSSSNMETVQVGFLKNDPSTPRICESIFIVCYFNINIIFEIFRI